MRHAYISLHVGNNAKLTNTKSSFTQKTQVTSNSRLFTITGFLKFYTNNTSTQERKCARQDDTHTHTKITQE